MRFKLSLSPFFISDRVEGCRYAQYLSPDRDGYIQLMINNLKEKLKVFTGQEPAFDLQDATFTLLNQPRQKRITIKAGMPKQSKLIGYQYNFKKHDYDLSI